MLTILIGIVGLATLLFFAFRFASNVMLAWYCFLGAIVISTTFGSSQVSVGPLHLDLSDVVNLTLLVAGILRISVRLNLQGYVRMAGLAFVAVLFVSLLRGIVVNGVFSAGVEGRGFVSELIGILYFTTIPTDEDSIRRMCKSFLWFGGVLVGVALLHYAGLNIGTTAELTDNLEKNRALPASSAQALALCFFMTLGWVSHRDSTKAMRILPSILVGFIVILQHRTVWNVLLAGVLGLAFLDLRMLKRFAPMAIVTGFLTVILAIGIYGTGAAATDQFQDSASNTGTWDWRVNQWKELIADDTSPIAIMIGQPLGSPYIHYVGELDVYEAVGPHSEYVHLYLRVGLIGTAFYVIFMLSPIGMMFVRHRRNRLSIFPSPSVWYAIVIGIVIYGITYPLDATGGVMIGIANALLMSHVEKTDGFQTVRATHAYALQT